MSTEENRFAREVTFTEKGVCVEGEQLPYWLGHGPTVRKIGPKLYAVDISILADAVPGDLPDGVEYVDEWAEEEVRISGLLGVSENEI